MVTKSVNGEYRARHLRPLPHKIDEYLPLWEARNQAILKGNKAEEERLTALMRPMQFDASAPEKIKNLITTVGRNDLLDKYLLGSAYTQTIRMGLKGAGSPAVGDTQASHAGWTERGLANAPAYTGNRKTVTMNAASGGVSVSPVQTFAITSPGNVDGCFINNNGSATVDNTSGILFSVGDFSAAKTVAALDDLEVTYTLTFS